jgi:pyruvate dehydrogenase E2 component (dihydrolipoamide acetyltransferase)
LPIGAVIARIGADAGPASGNGAAATAVGDRSDVLGGLGSPAVAAAAPVPVPMPGERTKASPLARRLARERGIDISALRGSGPGGRIVRADIDAAQQPPTPEAPPTPSPLPETPAPTPAPAVTETSKGPVIIQELTRTQQVVARRMAESKATVPEFTLTTNVDMTDAVALRTQIKTLANDGQAPVPSYNDMVIRACALALRAFPRANGAYRDGRFELYGRVNIGVAVAAPDTLVVPTVFDADQHTLTQIATITRGLADRVRTGQITPPELSGGTFTVSNLGMYGVSHFTAVINAPQAAILAVGALTPTAIPTNNGDISTRQLMPITLSCDHRILYGADAAQLLAHIRELLEKPVALLL